MYGNEEMSGSTYITAANGCVACIKAVEKEKSGKEQSCVTEIMILLHAELAHKESR